MVIDIDEYVKNLNEGDKKLIFHDNYKILLVKHNNSYFAIDAICTHEDESLASGFLSDSCIECPKHGARFDLSTGEVKALPAVRPLKTYKILQIDNKFMLSI